MKRNAEIGRFSKPDKKGYSPMRICVNGEYEELDDGLSLRDFLAARGLSPSEVVVERNLLIVMKDDYAKVRLMDGDTLEILRFVGGG